MEPRQRPFLKSVILSEGESRISSRLKGDIEPESKDL